MAEPTGKRFQRLREWWRQRWETKPTSYTPYVYPDARIDAELKKIAPERVGFLTFLMIPVEFMEECRDCGGKLVHRLHVASCMSCNRLYADAGYFPTLLDSGKPTEFPLFVDHEYFSHFKGNPNDDEEHVFVVPKHWHDLQKHKEEPYWDQMLAIWQEYVKYVHAFEEGSKGQEQYLNASPAVWNAILDDAYVNWPEFLNHFPFKGFPPLSPPLGMAYLKTVHTDGYALAVTSERAKVTDSGVERQKTLSTAFLRKLWYEKVEDESDSYAKWPEVIRECIDLLAGEIGTRTYILLDPDNLNLEAVSLEPLRREITEDIESIKEMNAKELTIYAKQSQLAVCEQLAKNLLIEGYHLRQAERVLTEKDYGAEDD